MNLRFHLREILAWITLFIAIVLFSVSMSFAQTNSVSVKNINGKVEVKLACEMNGKIVRSDTSFSIANENDLDKIVDAYVDLKTENQSNRKLAGSASKNEKDVKKKKIIIDLDIPEISEKERVEINEEIRNAMNEVENNLHEAYNLLKKLHIQIDTDDHFNSEERDSQVNIEKHFHHNNGLYSDSEIDNLKDSLSEEHFIILGDESENAPILEKVISTKNGKKVFVYKKNGTGIKKEETSVKMKMGKVELNIYPNPTNGKFHVKFISQNKEDITVKVSDESGKIVFNEMENDFLGEYVKEIDFSALEKGIYVVKVIQGKRTIAEKLILN